MNIERQDDLVMNAAGLVFGKMFQRMISEPLELEPLTGEVTMTAAERHQAMDDGLDEMLEGSIKMWSGALGEQIVRKGSRQKSAKPKRNQVKGRKPRRTLNTNSIIQLD